MPHPDFQKTDGLPSELNQGENVNYESTGDPILPAKEKNKEKLANRLGISYRPGMSTDALENELKNKQEQRLSATPRLTM